ncbi:unnamed protein product, partial [Urochloa humidicola]
SPLLLPTHHKTALSGLGQGIACTVPALVFMELPRTKPEPLEVEYVEIPAESAPEGKDVIVIEQEPDVPATIPVEVAETEIQQVDEDQ